MNENLNALGTTGYGALFLQKQMIWVVKRSSPKSFFTDLCLSCSPLDTRVNLAPLAMNTGLRSEMGLALMMFPPMDWGEQAESESRSRMQGRRWQLWQGALEDLTEQPSETWSFEETQKSEIKTLRTSSQLGNIRVCLQTEANSSELFSFTQPF